MTVKTPGGRWLALLGLWWWLMAGGAWASDAVSPAAALASAPAVVMSAASTPAGALLVHQRKVMTFKASLLGDSPADRVALARAALQEAAASGGLGEVSYAMLDDAARIEVDGQTVFFVVAGDLDGPRPVAALEPAAKEVVARLQTALDEAREATDPRSLARGVVYSLLASVMAYALLRVLWWARKRLTVQLQGALSRHHGSTAWGGLLRECVAHARSVTRAVGAALALVAVLVVLDAWATFVLRQFAYTRPWGERSADWMWDMAGQLVMATASAVPSLLVAVAIFLLARMGTKALGVLLGRVEQGQLQLQWLDAETAAPTRRLGSVLIWLFALAMAYPYLPGANSDAFKGVSVLAGLMLSLGASSVVGQALSGLTLMYSRSLREGEYVKVGETEGTVVALGMFTTRIHTGLGEEVSLPNAVVFSQPIRNFSRLVPDGRFVMHTAVTIGYAVPWRQVHAMLLDAARRTPGVAHEPAPYVVQTALSDFYVEYRLCAQGNKEAPRSRAQAMSQLHAHVQDVFNEHGVQIMSPHYLADPAQPQVVPPGPWATDADIPSTAPAPARRAD